MKPTDEQIEKAARAIAKKHYGDRWGDEGDEPWPIDEDTYEIFYSTPKEIAETALIASGLCAENKLLSEHNKYAILTLERQKEQLEKAKETLEDILNMELGSGDYGKERPKSHKNIFR